jgi:tetratricopeptide (TPR) repeat protein
MTSAATARPPAAANGGEIDILRSFARRIDPSDAGAYNNLGVLYFRKGLTDEAIVAFSRALALDERMGVARSAGCTTSKSGCERILRISKRWYRVG